ncbi:MAG: extracellular solute-binding protein [Arenicellales bacterium]
MKYKAPKSPAGEIYGGRRRFLRHSAAGALTLAAPAIISARSGTARADENTIRILGVTTVAPKDWSGFEKATGLKVEFTPMDDDIGVFLHEVMANDAGERYDLFAAFSGPFVTLSKGGYILPVDGSRLKRWAGVSENVRKSPLIMGGEGAVWSMPMVMNADSFAYFPKLLDLPPPPEPVSWGLLYDNKKTIGQVGLDDSWFTLQNCAAYLKWNKLADIEVCGNLTPSECDTVANFLIERKRAGQFRTMWGTFDEQVSLLLNREVVAETAWEPAAKEAQKQGADVAYAWTKEGYDKWMINAFIPKQVKDRGNLDQVYTALDYFLGGQYAAQIAVLRGYVTPRSDLGIDFAKSNGWSKEQVAQIQEAVDKLQKKFASDLFWNPGWPDHVKAYESAMSRFKNA